MTNPYEPWPPTSGTYGQPPQDAPQYPAPGSQWPTPQGVQGWPAQYPPVPPRRKSNTGLVIGLLAAVGIVGFVIFVAPIAFFAKMTDELNESIAHGSGAQTEQILESELEVTFGDYVRTDSKYYVSGKLPVTFRNKSNERATFNVHIEALDANGDRIAEDSVFVESLAPGQSTTKDVFTFTDDVEAADSAESFRVASVRKH